MFHPEAAVRFNQRADALRHLMRAVSATPKASATQYEPYPVSHVDLDNVIGRITYTDHTIDGLGRKVGRLWAVCGEHFGLFGDDYRELTSLAGAMANTPNLRGRVDVVFLVNEISSWIQATLEGTSIEDLATHVTRCCQEAVREYEIWVPVFQVHASDPFVIGDVSFHKLTPAVMDCFFNHPPPGPVPDAVRIRRERLRSQLQNHLAARVKVVAEKETARAIARSKAERTIALLRFLSPANQTPDIQSYCVPLGRERIEIPTELFVENGEIRQILRGTIEHGPVFWDVDPARARLPGLLERLDSLARDHSGDYRRQLYHALLLYSRNSVASETTDKLVFIVVSLESMLLKDGNEPISKNIGERLAFLIGSSVEERRAIVRNVDA